MHYDPSWIEERAGDCSGHHHQPLAIDPIVIDAGAIQHLPLFIRERNYQKVLVVADDHTYKAAGARVYELLQASGLHVTTSIVRPNEQGDVVADGNTLIKLMLDISPGKTDTVIAVGAGTIHDIVRFVVFKMGIPFISVPTAPSVDGFTSRGAPIIVDGLKQTFPASAPEAIFADLDVLQRAPQAMVAAGFGDMLAKCTSLFDWKFSAAVHGEAYCETAASVTRKALDDCVQHVEAIARRDREGIRMLITALIESGLAMLLFGQSHPASGAEHHLSHYWEIDYLRTGRRQLLHGAKVGVATTLIAELYLRHAFAPHFPREVHMAAKEMPSPEQIREWLQKVGGPTTTSDLGIPADLRARSLQEAHMLRDRHTLLRELNRSNEHNT